MAALLDTDVVIHLLDGDTRIAAAVRKLEAPLFISLMTRIELENGVQREPKWAAARQANLDRLLVDTLVLPFAEPEIAAYRRILAGTGYSRRKVADRMTAATAIVNVLPLVTLNGRDYRDVPGLGVIAWAAPA